MVGGTAAPLYAVVIWVEAFFPLYNSFQNWSVYSSPLYVPDDGQVAWNMLRKY
jgi:hypothetical protein